MIILDLVNTILKKNKPSDDYLGLSDYNFENTKSSDEYASIMDVKLLQDNMEKKRKMKHQINHKMSFTTLVLVKSEKI